MPNSFQVATKSRIKRAARTGFDRGRIMLQNIRKWEAPSTNAASSRSLGYLERNHTG
jgi:hypothetical protein